MLWGIASSSIVKEETYCLWGIASSSIVKEETYCLWGIASSSKLKKKLTALEIYFPGNLFGEFFLGKTFYELQG